MAEGFVAYRGDRELHDGMVVALEQDGETAWVVIEAGSGRRFEVRFFGVESLTQLRAEGMMLYALAEMEGEPPLRRFVFVNWDEDDEAQLDVLARDLDYRELP